MIIDIHSHILPGVDDGAKNMDETIRMLDIAMSEGIEGIVVTPHFETGKDAQWRLKFKKAYQQVTQYILENWLPIKLYGGNEIYYSDSVTEELQSKHVCTINKSKYILVEFPMYADFLYVERALRNLQYAGYWPIIAHVERYESLRDIEYIRKLKNMDVCIQINADSIVDKERRKTRSFCKKLISNRLVDVIATDMHDSKHRKPELRSSFEWIDKKMGESYRKLISEENPEKIVKGMKICE